MIQNYKDLVVWQKAVELAEKVYMLTKKFPSTEQCGLVSQLTRAAVSVASNIAEGNGRSTTKDYIHFLHQARGSLFEAETQLIIAKDLGWIIDSQDVFPLVDEVSRMLNSILSRLSSK